MRNLFIVAALSFGIISLNANADEATLQAIQEAGVELTEQQINSFPKKSCDVTEEMIKKDELPEGCQSLVDAVAALIADNAGNDAAVEAILRAASNAHPNLTQAFGDAAINAAPTQVALIAGLITELAPAAAGPAGPTLANITNNTPVSIGGGGSSSPN